MTQFFPFARENRGFKYIFVVRDCFYKYIWTKPIKDKSALNVKNALESIFKLSKRTPNKIQTDTGNEFYNKYFKFYGIV